MSAPLTCPFFWIDAFTAKRGAGNPCAVLHLETFLPDNRLVAIACEMGLSETAFVRTADPARGESSDFDFEARYFAPEREIPLAGHPTLATIRSLLDAGKIAAETNSVRLKLPAGIIRVDLDHDPNGRVLITMEQRPPEFYETFPRAETAAAFGLSESDLHVKVAPQIVSTGTRGLIVPIRNLEALRRAKTNREAYDRLSSRANFFSAHLFFAGGLTERGGTFARHPGTSELSAEDPFTGSATGAMAAYAWKHGLISSPRFIAEQGHWMGRPGEASVEVVGTPEAIRTVRVGGEAVTLITGQYVLEE